MNHELAEQSMCEANWPARVRANIIDCNMNLKAIATLPPADSIDFNFEKCMKQGSNEAPRHLEDGDLQSSCRPRAIVD